jgi:hypothetical protein
MHVQPRRQTLNLYLMFHSDIAPEKEFISERDEMR